MNIIKYSLLLNFLQKDIMRTLTPIFAFLLALVFSVFLSSISMAKSADEAEAVTIEQLQRQLKEIPATSKDNNDLQRLNAELNQIKQRADVLLSQVTQQVVELEQKLSSISQPATAPTSDPADPQPAEQAPEEVAAPEPAPVEGPETLFIAEQRDALQKEHARLDAQRKHLILIISEAEEKSKLLVAERRQRFKDELSLQVRSILNPNFWSNWHQSLPADITRLQAFKSELTDIIKLAVSPANRWPLMIGLIFSAIVFVFANRFLNQMLNLFLVRVIPTGRARRSFFALSKVLFRILAFAIVCLVFYTGLNWHDILSLDFKLFLRQIFYTILFSAFIYGLGEAILCVKHDSWRLLKLSFEEAYNLRRFPILLMIISLVYQVVVSTGNYIELDFISEVNIKTIFTLLLCLWSLTFFSRLSYGRVRGKKDKHAGQTNGDNSADNASGSSHDATSQAAGHQTVNSGKHTLFPIWLLSLIGLFWFFALLATIITLTGYVSLGSFMVNQLVWTVLVSASFYIAWKLSDDAYQALFGSQALIGKYLITSYEFSENVLNQFIVILSAISKVLLMYALIKILLLPFGTNITEFAQVSNTLNTLVTKNTFALTTSGIISAIAIFLLGFWVIRLFKSWLETKYFPNTKLETGVQSSISTMSGYLGGVAVIALSLGSMGLSFDKITWVASALSVGIGFGLQSIVQNFISGLILLTERPVKVGDWVVVGNDDGDIKRINIRATEIQLFDRSTLIVPNSEFITKAVRNMTLDKSEGRVKITLSLPISTNPRIVSDMILEVFGEHELVLDEMAPFIRLDSVDGGSLTLSATCYVPSPRLVGQVRTELLFEILDRLHQAEITLINPVHINQINTAMQQSSPPTTNQVDMFKS